MKREGEGKSGSPLGVGGNRRGEGRFSARRKRVAVERMVRGEDLELLSRELGVTAATLSEWRRMCELGAEAALKRRHEHDEHDAEIARLKAKVGDLTMDNELLYEKIHRMEEQRPLRWRRLR